MNKNKHDFRIFKTIGTGVQKYGQKKAGYLLATGLLLYYSLEWIISTFIYTVAG